MLNNNNNNNNTASSSENTNNNGVVSTAKRKRRPAGTPDPDAEVVALSPKTLMESDRYVCEICGQGFQRDQNLQMHRRRHKVPWKLLKRENRDESESAMRKRVFVCPEPSCLHHHPCHALGDLVGIKKHFRRKHSTHKQWACQRCSKAYAVHSDFKAHLKTCGTRGHSCDCGRVFSRVESFIEHQDSCTVRSVRPELQALQSQPSTAASSRTASSTSPSSDANFSHNNNNSPPAGGFPILPPGILNPPKPILNNNTEEQPPIFLRHQSLNNHHRQHFLELQLLPSSSSSPPSTINNSPDDNFSTRLKLSIGSSSSEDHKAATTINAIAEIKPNNGDHNNGQEVVKAAMAEKAYAEEARREAKRQIEIAEAEFANAKRIRQQAQAELEKAQLLRGQATKKISSTMLQITCQACKQQFQTTPSLLAGWPADETTSLAMSYMSSATTEGE